MHGIRLLRLALMLFLVYCPATVYTQDRDFLQGRLYDTETREGVAFATVRLEGNAIGVVSNEDGSFRIPARFGEMGEFLRISSMGYESIRIPVASLLPGIVNRIALSPRVFELSETVLEGRRVKKRSARNIVKTAIARIPANYPQYPFRLIGYYRDYQKKSAAYLNLNEAILEVNDLGFHTDDKADTRVRLYDYRNNDEFPRDSFASAPYDYQKWSKVINNAYLYNYGGNEFSILRIHDAIRNHAALTYSFIDKLDADLLRNHNFKRLDDTNMGDIPCYTISFGTRRGDYRARGTIVIARHNFAIFRLNYALYDETILPAEGDDPSGESREYQLMFAVRTEYQPVRSSMYLNYISFRNRFRLIKPPKFAVDSIAADIGRGCFQVYFSDAPSEESALDLRHYKAVLGGKNIKLAEARIEDQSVLLFPPEDKRYMLKTLTKYSGKEVGESEAQLSVKGVQDRHGNWVDVSEKINLLQFREFFTQKVLEKAPAQPAYTYMLKEHPIFKDQAVTRPVDFEEYWMNTPLQDSN